VLPLPPPPASQKRDRFGWSVFLPYTGSGRCHRCLLPCRVMPLSQAQSAASEALKLLTFLSRPTVKAAGRLQKRLVIEEGGHDREQVKRALRALRVCLRFVLVCLCSCPSEWVHAWRSPCIRGRFPTLKVELAAPVGVPSASLRSAGRLALELLQGPLPFRRKRFQYTTPRQTALPHPDTFLRSIVRSAHVSRCLVECTSDSEPCNSHPNRTRPNPLAKHET